MRLQRPLALLFVLSLVLPALAAPFSAKAAKGTEPYVGFRKHTTAADFGGSTLSGVEIDSRNGGADINLAASGLSTGTN